MKKSVSILLSLLMLTIAVDPTLMVHFCGGSLASVSLVGDQEQAYCCGNLFSSNTTTDSGTYEQSPCCYTNSLEVASSDYDSYRIASHVKTSIAKYVVNIGTHLLNTCSSPHATSIESRFPPEGLSKQTVDFLALICIYRI